MEEAKRFNGSFIKELRELFYQRTRISLWLGVVFFSLFSILDYLYSREFYFLFLFYRLSLVLVLLLMLNLLRFSFFKRYVAAMMYVGMLLGTLTISLMIVKLGGFSSGYYVGILLMIAGGFTVLPYTVSQALLTGLSMYLVYILTIALGTANLETSALVSSLNNTIFFFTIVVVTAIQCFDDFRSQKKSFFIKMNLQALLVELQQYRGNLETMVLDRVKKVEETGLKFKDLYDNIQDLVVLIDGGANIKMVNRNSGDILGNTPEKLQGKRISSFMTAESGEFFNQEIVKKLAKGEDVQGMQLRMVTRGGRIIEVELGGNRVNISEYEVNFLLIIRDISATKKMEEQVLESDQLLDTSRQAAIFGLARLAECRDDDTGTHLTRIREYTRILAIEIASNGVEKENLTARFVENIVMSSVLHDIGKVGIPDSILLKPGSLTETEFERMKQHCDFGGFTLSSAEKGSNSVSFLQLGQEIARYHHEKWDGSGYPEGLVGKDIPLSARIVALADVYDALTSSRPYKPAYNHDKARAIITSESGKQFDPTVVEAFLRKEQEFKQTRLSFLLGGRANEIR